MPIKRSKRLEQVHREFYGYSDRKDFFRLDRNEDPVGWNKHIFSKLLKDLSTYDLTAYSDSNNLLNKLSEWTNSKQDNIYITAGADGAIKNIFEVYLDPNDSVLMQDPCWPMYWVYSNVYQAKILKQNYSNEIKFDVKKFILTIETEKPKIVILANPNMPTGTMICFEDMRHIAKVCNKNKSLFVIDEAYHLFSSFTCQELINEFDNVVLVRTFSKAFGLAGLRTGYCMSNSEVIKNLMLVRPIADANNIGLRTACFAIDNIDYVKGRIKDFLDGRDYLYKKFIQNGIKTHKSEGNFLLIGCSSLEKAQNALSLMKDKHYLLKGPYNYHPLENYIRVTIGPLELMEKFWHDCSDIVIDANN